MVWSLFGCGAMVLHGAVPAPAPAPVAAEPALELPKYTVTNQLLLPKPESWRYATIPGFEVLSCASPSATEHFLRDFQTLQLVIDIVWPVLRKASTPVPGTLVLYGGGREADLMDAAVRVKGDEILEFEPLSPEEESRRTASVFFSNREAACIVVDLRPIGSGMADPYRQFYREYVNHLFSRMEVRTSPWLREGMARLFAGVDFTDKWIKFATVDSERMGDFNTMLSRSPAGMTSQSGPASGGRESLSQDFSPAAQGRPYTVMGAFPLLSEMLQADEMGFRRNPYFRYLAQAFVHMCLYGRGQQYQKPFLLYLAKTNGGFGSEQVFQECFGMSMKKMQEEIVGYVSFTDYKSVTYKAKKGQSLPVPPATVLREATQAEVGRVKGEGLILAGRRDIARVAFLAPYLRKQQDPDLLASLGLYEIDAGRADRARQFLELAARGGTKRARAYLELARLRKAGLPAAGETVAATPPESVIGPLRAAAALEPPLLEVYEAIAREWLLCSTPPPAGDLAALEKGAARFYRQLKLVYDTAHLHAAAGSSKKAAYLADWGVHHALAAADKERFAQLLATLPAAPAGDK
jgi:hypothetical protein